jgi:hypothetical protein
MRLAGARRPEQHDVLLAEQEVELRQMGTISFFTLRWKLQSNSSRVLRAGKRAALMRASPPWASREDRSVPRSASAKRS